jgi:hypothetical protein
MLAGCASRLRLRAAFSWTHPLVVGSPRGPFQGQASIARPDTLAGQWTFLHDLPPIWEGLIDRICHVDERFVKEGCGMPDSLKPVKSYDWTDEEWLRLMREIDPREEISAIERRVAEWRDAADDDAG